MKKNLAYQKLMIILTITMIFSVIIALSLGRYSMNPADVIGAITTKISGAGSNETMEDVLFVIRLPRIIAAVLIGAALSLSGAIYQGIFKNPLVSPDLLGVSSGACVGAAISILLGFSIVGTQISAFVGGIIAVCMTITIPKLLRNSSNIVLVLAGIIVGGFMYSILGLLKYVADPETELASIVFWQMGSVATTTMKQIIGILPLALIAMVFMVMLSWRINILSFGDDEAKSLGVNVKLLRGLTIACASFLTAGAVSISGTIGWIGLVIPHLSRLLVGPDNTKMFPCAIMVGGIFMLVIDTLSRVTSTVEIPLSILTGLIGAPFYLWILWNQKAKI